MGLYLVPSGKGQIWRYNLPLVEFKLYAVSPDVVKELKEHQRDGCCVFEGDREDCSWNDKRMTLTPDGRILVIGTPEEHARFNRSIKKYTAKTKEEVLGDDRQCEKSHDTSSLEDEPALRFSLKGPARHELIDYYSKAFGTPIVTGQYLIFSDPEPKPHRIVCVTRNKGEKIWEVKDDRSVLHPWFMLEGNLVVTKGGDVFQCNIQYGALSLLYKTGYARCDLTAYALPLVLIRGEKENADYLSLVDLRESRKKWEKYRMRRVIAQGHAVMLCLSSERQYNSDGSYSDVNQKIVAISSTDGKELWRRHQSAVRWDVEGVAISEYFVVNVAGTIRSYEQKTGNCIKTLRLQGEPWQAVCLAIQNRSVLVRTQEGASSFAVEVVYALGVPDLNKTELTMADWRSAVCTTSGDTVIDSTDGVTEGYDRNTGRKIWRGEPRDWNGIHDGWIYYSTTEANGTHRSVNKIEVSTGRRVKIYEEVIPRELQRKPHAVKPSMPGGDDVAVVVE